MNDTVFWTIVIIAAIVGLTFKIAWMVLLNKWFTNRKK